MKKTIGPWTFDAHEFDGLVNFSDLAKIGEMFGVFMKWLVEGKGLAQMSANGIHWVLVDEWYRTTFSNSGWNNSSNTCPPKFSGKVEAIKYLRTVTGCGLADGKAFVDAVMAIPQAKPTPETVQVDGIVYRRY